MFMIMFQIIDLKHLMKLRIELIVVQPLARPQGWPPLQPKLEQSSLSIRPPILIEPLMTMAIAVPLLR